MNNQGQFPYMFPGNQNAQHQQQGMSLEQITGNLAGFNTGLNTKTQMSAALMNQHNSALTRQQQSNLMSSILQQHSMMGNYQGTMEQNQGMMGQNQGMIGQNQGMMGQNQGMMGQNQGIMGKNQGMMGKNQGMVGQNQGMMGTNQGMMGQNLGMIGQNQGMVGQNQGMMGQNQGMMGQNQGMMGQNQGMMGKNQGMMGNNQGMMGQNQSTIREEQGMVGLQYGTTGRKQEVIGNDNSNWHLSNSSTNRPAAITSEPVKLRSILKNSGSASTPVSQSSISNMAANVASQIKSILKKSTPTQYPVSDTVSERSASLEQASSLENISKHYSASPMINEVKSTKNVHSTITPVSTVSRTQSIQCSANQISSNAQRSMANQIHRSKPSNQTTADNGSSQSVTRTNVWSGKSIPTLVSGNRKRKVDSTVTHDTKKSKTALNQMSVQPQDNDDEDPEYVQAQIFISNIDASTSKEMILEILRHYRFPSPKVWIGRHAKSNEICAFVKLPSLKDSKRVIAEMKGFPYKGREMEIRFCAAADFMDFNVSDKDKGLFSVYKKSITQSPEQVPADRESLLQTATILPMEQLLTPFQVGTEYPTVMVPIYPAVPQYSTPMESEIDLNNEGRYRDDLSDQQHMWQASPGWAGSSPRSYTDGFPNLYEEQSAGNHGFDARYHSDQRYSRSPGRDGPFHSYETSGRSSLSPQRDRRYQNTRPRSRRSSISPSSGRRSGISPSRGRRSSISPSKGRRSTISPQSKHRKSVSPFRGQISSMSPFRGHRTSVSPSRGQMSSVSPSRGRRSNMLTGRLGGVRDGSHNRSVHSNEDSFNRTRGETDNSIVTSLFYCVYISNLPPDLEDSDLEILVSPYPYDGVRLKVKDGKAEASITLKSRADAELMVQDIHNKIYLGVCLNAVILEEQTSGTLNPTREPAGSKAREGRSSEKVKTVDEKTNNTLFQIYVDASYANAPVLGRKYIKEFTSIDSTTAYYLCILCEKTFSWRDIADHVMGFRHRLQSMRRSHPKIYEKLCLIPDKMEMIKQCTKYASELVNNNEQIVTVTESHPEQASLDNLRRIQGRQISEIRISSDKGLSSSTLDKKTSSDSTSDIFKKIAAYKKKFEACQDAPDEIEINTNPAKRRRGNAGNTGTRTLKFEDLQKQNKSLADSIVAEIASARQDTNFIDNPERIERRSSYVRKRPPRRRGNRSRLRGKYKSDEKAVASRAKSQAELDKAKFQESIKESRARAEQIKKTLGLGNQEGNPVSDKNTRVDTVRKKRDKVVSDNNEANPTSNVLPVTDKFLAKIDNNKTSASVPIAKTVDKSEDDVRIGKTGDVTNKEKKDTENAQNTEKHEVDDSELTQTEKKEDQGSVKEIAVNQLEGITAELLEEGLVDMEEEVELSKDKNVCITLINPSSHPRSKLHEHLNDRLTEDPDKFVLLGLEYAIEIVPRANVEDLNYLCSLCGIQGTGRGFISHLFGFRHKSKYMEMHETELYNICKGKSLVQFKAWVNSESLKKTKQVLENPQLQKVITMTELEFKEKKLKEKQEKLRTAGADKHMVDEVVNFQTKLKEIAEHEESVVNAETESAKDELDTSLRCKITEAKKFAKPISMQDGRDTVVLYKYIRLKPGIPLLGLSSVVEIQGLYGPMTKTAVYVCNLCCPVKKIDGVAPFYEHLTGNKHMENYLKQNFPHKMIHLKLITQRSAKSAYLLNQAKLVSQTQSYKYEPINMVNLITLEEERIAAELLKAARMAEEAARVKAEAEAAREQEKVRVEAMAAVARERDKTREAAAAAVKAANAQALDSASRLVSSSVARVTEMGDVTKSGTDAGPVTAHLYEIIAGLQNTAVVGLSYITEIHGILEDHGSPRYICSLCHDEVISDKAIKSHLIGNNHMLNFLKANYPVFYSKAEGNYEEALKYCQDIEEQFGRESVRVKTRLESSPDTTVYSDPVVSKAPVHKASPANMTEKAMEEEEPEPDSDLEFYKLLKRQDGGPLVGLQFLREVHHPTRKYTPVYECSACQIHGQNFLTTENVLTHLRTNEHRLNFFKENHYHIFKEIKALFDDKESMALLDKRTEEIESKVGRGVVEKVVSGRLLYWKEANTQPFLRQSKAQKNFSEEGNKYQEKRQFKCKKCLQLVSMEERRGHILAAHIALYKCKICDLSFPSHTLQTRHNIKMDHLNPNVRFKDKTINFNMHKWFAFVFESRKGRLEESNNTGKLHLMCQKCNTCCRPEDAQKHYITCHLQGYKCEKCLAPHGTSRELEKHLKLAHDISKYVKSERFDDYGKMKKSFCSVYTSAESNRSKSTEADAMKVNKSVPDETMNGTTTVKPSVSTNQVNATTTGDEIHVGKIAGQSLSKNVDVSGTEKPSVSGNEVNNANTAGRMDVGSNIVPNVLSKEVKAVKTGKSWDVSRTVGSSVSGNTVKATKTRERKDTDRDKKTETDAAPFDLTIAENQEKIMREIKKLFCIGCRSVFRHISSATIHYNCTHAHEYICIQCYMKFPTGVKLRDHCWYKHNKTIDVQLPVISFNQCFDVILQSEKRTAFRNVLKIVQQKSVQSTEKVARSGKSTANKQGSTQSAHKPAFSTVSKPESASVSSKVSSATTAASVSSVNQSKKICREPVSRTSPEKTTLEGLLNIKEDPLFDWDSEYDKIVEKMEFGEMISSARKSKFVISYTSTFSTYPVIGLQWITEFQKRDIKMEPWYICELCKDKVTYEGINGHVTSVKHRVNYMKMTHPASYIAVQQTKYSSIDLLKKKINTLSQEVANKEGKPMSITVMIEVPQSDDEDRSTSAKFENLILQEDKSVPVSSAVAERNTSTTFTTKQTQSMKKTTDFQSKDCTEEDGKNLPPWQKIPYRNEEPSERRDKLRKPDEDSRMHAVVSSKVEDIARKTNRKERSKLDNSNQQSSRSKQSKPVSQSQVTSRGNYTIVSSLERQTKLKSSVLSEKEDVKTSNTSTNLAVTDVIDLTFEEDSAENEPVEILLKDETDLLSLSIKEHLMETESQLDQAVAAKKEITVPAVEQSNTVFEKSPVNECFVEFDDEDFDGEFEIKDEVGEPDVMVIDIVPQSPETVMTTYHENEVENVTCSIEINLDEGAEITQNTCSPSSKHPLTELLPDVSKTDINVIVMDSADSVVELQVDKPNVVELKVEKPKVLNQDMAEKIDVKFTDSMKQPSHTSENLFPDCMSPANQPTVSRKKSPETNAIMSENMIASDVAEQFQKDVKTNGNDLVIAPDTDKFVNEKKDLIEDMNADSSNEMDTDTNCVTHVELTTELESESCCKSISSQYDLPTQQDKEKERVDADQACFKENKGTEDSLKQTFTDQNMSEIPNKSLVEAEICHDSICSPSGEMELPDNDHNPCPSVSCEAEFAIDEEFVTVDEHCEPDPEQTATVDNADIGDGNKIIMECNTSNEKKSGENVTDSEPLDSNVSFSTMVIDYGSEDGSDIEEIFLSSNFVAVDEETVGDDTLTTDRKHSMNEDVDVDDDELDEEMDIDNFITLDELETEDIEESHQEEDIKVEPVDLNVSIEKTNSPPILGSTSGENECRSSQAKSDNQETPSKNSSSSSLSGQQNVNPTKQSCSSKDRSPRSSSDHRSPATSNGGRSPTASTGCRSPAASTGHRSPATSTGHRSPAASTGRHSPAASTKHRSPATSTERQSPATRTERRSTATKAEQGSQATNAGHPSPATNAGHRSPAPSTGHRSSAPSTGHGLPRTSLSRSSPRHSNRSDEGTVSHSSVKKDNTAGKHDGPTLGYSIDLHGRSRQLSACSFLGVPISRHHEQTIASKTSNTNDDAVRSGAKVDTEVDPQKTESSCVSRHNSPRSAKTHDSPNKSDRQTESNRSRRNADKTGSVDEQDDRIDRHSRIRASSRHSGNDRRNTRRKERECKVSIEID